MVATLREELLATSNQSEPASSHGFVTASGKVDALRLLPRDLYWRRLRPATPSGLTVVIAPGYPQGSSQWQGLARSLTSVGHDVIAFDQQWSGYSEGEVGKIDSGEALARDTAAVVAMASAQQRHEGGSGEEIVLVGGGLGASAGILAALTLRAQERLHLDGLPMPNGLRSVLVAPLFRATPTLANRLRVHGARLPGAAALANIDEPSPAQSVRSLFWLASLEPSLQRVWDGVETARAHIGMVTIFHSHKDPIADPKASAALAELLGLRGRLRGLHGDEHHLHTTTAGIARIVEAVTGH